MTKHAVRDQGQTETLDEYLKRGGKITFGPKPVNIDPQKPTLGWRMARHGERSTFQLKHGRHETRGDK